MVRGCGTAAKKGLTEGETLWFKIAAAIGQPVWFTKRIVPYGEYCGWSVFFEWQATQEHRPESLERATIAAEIRALYNLTAAAPGTRPRPVPPAADFVPKYRNRFAKADATVQIEDRQKKQAIGLAWHQAAWKAAVGFKKPKAEKPDGADGGITA